MNIKILKDTPFDKAGASIPISEFRLKYNYICSIDTTDEELINCLRSAQQGYPIGNMAAFFEVDDAGAKVPIEFIFNGLVYIKLLDGLYHIFMPGAPLNGDYSIRCITIHDAEKIFSRAKHRKLVWYCTDNIVRKL